MKLLIQRQYRASRKEPFGTLLRRLHDGFVEAGLPVAYEFAFSDGLVPGGVSAVARAVKKYPHLAGLVPPDGPSAIGGDDGDLPFAGLTELADGLPRSLPFHAAVVRFFGPEFGLAPPQPGWQTCGVAAHDNWWVNGRMRALSAGYVLEVRDSSRKLPEPEGPLGAVLATLGKPAKTNQQPIADGAPVGHLRAPEVDDLVRRIRARFPELVSGAAMPHVLEDPRVAPPDYSQHPLKPALERYFRPLGYSCKGGSGTFTLRRRTAANHVVEVDLDVGTWSRRVSAHFRVHLPGSICSFAMPVAPGLSPLQYPIGDEARWERIVENLAALAAHLDTQIVPEIDAVAGPAPEWFDAPG